MKRISTVRQSLVVVKQESRPINPQIWWIVPVISIVVGLLLFKWGKSPANSTSKIAGKDSTEVPLSVTDTNTSHLSVRELFTVAGQCANPDYCPAWDELARRVQQPNEIDILVVGTEVMSLPESNIDSGPGRLAAWSVGVWLDAQATAGNLTEARRVELVTRLRKVIDSGSSNFRRSAFSMLGMHPEYGLPNAEQILREEATRTDRSDDDIRGAAYWLSSFQHDLRLVKEFIRQRNGPSLIAGVALMRRLSFQPFCDRNEIVRILNELAKRRDLPSTVALDVIALCKLLEDSQLRPVIHTLAQYPDSIVRAAAKDAAMELNYPYLWPHK